MANRTAFQTEHGKVSKPSTGPTVLIVDDDLGLIWWLGDMFHEAGYRPVPALSARQALSFVEELNLKVAVVVVNPELLGVRRMIKTLNHSDRNHVGIILVSDSRDSTTDTIRAHAILDRPSGLELPSRQEWRRKLHRILKQLEETAAPKLIGYPFRKHQ